MNRRRIFEGSILGLMILNLTVLGFILFKPTSNPETASEYKVPNPSIRSEIIEILNLNEEQITHFHSLADEHRDEMRRLEVLKTDLLSTYFESIVDSSAMNKKEATLSALQKLEVQKLEATYEHFRKFNELLAEDQLSDFKKVMGKITNKP